MIPPGRLSFSLKSLTCPFIQATVFSGFEFIPLISSVIIMHLTEMTFSLLCLSPTRKEQLKIVEHVAEDISLVLGDDGDFETCQGFFFLFGN